MITDYKHYQLSSNYHQNITVINKINLYDEAK